MTSTASIVDAHLVERARHWLAADPDPDTRATMNELLTAYSNGDVAAAHELADAFAGQLEFGTAGLRAAMGPGPNRMNRVTVSRAAAGLAGYLAARQSGSVVIGYDARHKSDLFARDTAEILEGAGFRALLLPRALPTPVLAYAIRALGCIAGVMVTASHNPAGDNGYKVYLGDGAQIAPPIDTAISAAINAVGAHAEICRALAAHVVSEDVIDSYVRDVVALIPDSAPREISVVYTAMHGVGGSIFQRLLADSGFAPAHPVAAQFAPNPDFPTVAFPNPEEPGAMDLAIAEAIARDADLVIANDPDADRCAAGVPIRSDGSDGQTAFRMLRGDEVGWLLAWWMYETGTRGVFANSIVSSSLLGKMAAAYGLEHRETLTGFKYLGHLPGLAYGYEEALGYCVDPGHVSDKDGLSAGLRIAQLVAALKSQGRTVHDILDELAVTFGVHATHQLSIRVANLSLIDSIMARLRASPPLTIAGRLVLGIDDFAVGVDGLPMSNVLRLRLIDDTRVIVRPSGTEPKLKCYLEVVVPVRAAGESGSESTSESTAENLAAARHQAAQQLESLVASMTRILTPDQFIDQGTL